MSKEQVLVVGAGPTGLVLALYIFTWATSMKKAGLKKDAIYLVRPDAHIGLAVPAGKVGILENYLGRRQIEGNH